MSSRRARSQDDVEAVRLDIEQRGARIAYEALLQVCQDPKAPAQAKAAAGVAVLRAGGLYDAKRRPALDDDPAEASAADLRQALAFVQAERAQVEAGIAERAALIAGDADEGGEDDEADIFA